MELGAERVRMGEGETLRGRLVNGDRRPKKGIFDS
jgi:hypothetical protein